MNKYSFLKMKVKSQHLWHFKTGKHTETKNIIIVQSELFSHPTILTGDLHSYGYELFTILDSYINLKSFTILSVGDMAGDFNKGSDCDPTELYKFLIDHSKEFYYVQGNHDLASPETEDYNIPDGKTVDSLVGKIGGINGIISNKEKLYRLCEKDYIIHLKGLMDKRPAILLTHDTPAIPVIDPKYKSLCIGQEKIYSNLKSPLIHVYGHCHHTDFYHHIQGIHFINADARVIICIPNDMDEDQLINYELSDAYF